MPRAVDTVEFMALAAPYRWAEVAGFMQDINATVDIAPILLDESRPRTTGSCVPPKNGRGEEWRGRVLETVSEEEIQRRMHRLIWFEARVGDWLNCSLTASQIMSQMTQKESDRFLIRIRKLMRSR